MTAHKPAKSFPVPKIETGFDLPVGRGDGQFAMLRKLIPALKIGESFLWPGRVDSLYVVAKKINCRITTRRMENGTLRVWRINFV